MSTRAMTNKTLDQYPSGLRDALNALYGPHKPLTPKELAEHNSRCAAAQARAEARIHGASEDDLLDGGK